MNSLHRAVPAVLLLLLLAAESRAAGLLVPRDGSPPIAVKSHRVEAVVSDGMARTKVRQTFVNPGNRPLEAVYVFPLPEGAALTAVAMETGGQRLEGLLAERKRARKIYDDIVRRKRDPALVEQIGREMFRLSVFPVNPGEDTVVEIEYVEHVPLTRGEFRWIYPLASEGKTTVTKQDLTVSVRIHSSLAFTEVSSPQEDMQVVHAAPGLAKASLERIGAALSDDVVLVAKVEVPKPTLTLDTWRGGGGEGIFLALVTPPPVRKDQLIPRDVILVVDTSGSMRGRKIEQAKVSALYLLDNLRPVDRVNVVRFSSDVQPFADGPVPADPENLARLREFVLTFEAKGGTAIADALKNAVHVEKAEGRVRTVVFLTDGRPTVGEKEPVALVKIAKAGVDKGLRIFPFGVGEDVDGGLLRGIAHATRGRAEIFRPGGEVESRLTSFLLRTSAPVLSDLQFEVDGLLVHDVFPRPLPDAYLGEQVAIVGRYPGGGECDVTVSANFGGERKGLTVVGDFRKEQGGEAAVRDLFAKRKLDWLEEQLRLRLGLADDAYYEALDRGAYGTEGEIVEELIATSLEHGVQCAHTSFLVLLPEDRARLDPRDANAIAEALERVRKARGEVAMTDGEEAPEESLERVAKASGATFGHPGSSTPSPGGGVSSGSDGGGRASPPNPGGPTAGVSGGEGGVGAPSNGAKRARPNGMGRDTWFEWWRRNGGELLDRKTAGNEALDPAAARDAKAVILSLSADESLPGDVRSAAGLAAARAGVGDVDRRGHAHLKALADEGRSFEARALAALALASDPGGASDPALVLLGVVGDESTSREILPAAMIALGLLGDRSTASPLAELAFRPGGSATETRWILHALGRIGGPDAFSAAKKCLTERQFGAERAAAAALGALGPGLGVDDQKALALLLGRKALDGKDDRTAGYAAIALGRLGAGTSDEDIRDRCVKLLGKVFERSGRGERRSYAALALGILGTGDTPLGEGDVRLLGNRLREEIVKRRGDRGGLAAVAIALGLIGDDREENAQLLLDVLSDPGEDHRFRGGAALALGLLRAESARAAVAGCLKDRGHSSWTRGCAASALALSGGEPSAGELAELVRSSRESSKAREAVARALGRLRQPAAVAALGEVALDKGEDEWLRAAAVLSLGRLLASTPPPALARDLPADRMPEYLWELLRWE